MTDDGQQVRDKRQTGGDPGDTAGDEDENWGELYKKSQGAMISGVEEYVPEEFRTALRVIAAQQRRIALLEKVAKSEDVKLGRTQVHMLRCLINHGEWYEQCGWTWSGDNKTIKLCESLVLRGVATEIVKKIQHARSGNTYERRCWVPSNLGRCWYEAHRSKSC